MLNLVAKQHDINKVLLHCLLPQTKLVIVIKKLINKIEHKKSSFWHPEHRHEKISRLKGIENNLISHQKESISAKELEHYEQAINNVYDVAYDKFHAHGFFDQKRARETREFIESLDLDVYLPREYR